MSLQNIILPDLLISELYKKVHHFNDETVIRPFAKVPDNESAGYKFLGSNTKRIGFIVRYPGEVFLPERHLEFLIRLLGACKLDIGDVAIVNDGFKAVDINKLAIQLQPKQLILFGTEPTELNLPFSFPQFKLQEYALCTYLYVPAVDSLNNDSEEAKLLKTRLWICLRTMFDVSVAK